MKLNWQTGPQNSCPPIIKTTKHKWSKKLKRIFKIWQHRIARDVGNDDIRATDIKPTICQTQKVFCWYIWQAITRDAYYFGVGYERRLRRAASPAQRHILPLMTRVRKLPTRKMLLIGGSLKINRGKQCRRTEITRIESFKYCPLIWDELKLNDIIFTSIFIYTLWCIGADYGKKWGAEKHKREKIRLTL